MAGLAPDAQLKEKVNSQSSETKQPDTATSFETGWPEAAREIAKQFPQRLALFPWFNTVGGALHLAVNDFFYKAPSLDRPFFPNEGLMPPVVTAMSNRQNDEQSVKRPLVLPRLLGLRRNGATLHIATKEDLDKSPAQFPSMEKVFISSEGLRLPVVTGMSMRRDGERTLKRPLLIHLPGIGRNLDDIESRFVLRNVEKRGAHGLIIPDPFSRDYLAACPKNAPGSFIQEAQAVLSIIKNAVRKISPENISYIDLQGGSYGAFLSIVAAGLDGESGSERLFHRVTAISPQIQLEKTHNKMDDLMKSLPEVFADMADPSPMSYPLHDAWARILLGTSTQSSLSKAVETFLRNRERCAVEYPEEIPKRGYPIRPELMTTGFRQAITNHSPENLYLYDKERRKDHLRYWITKINEHNDPTNPLALRVITTRRDPLNDFEDWEDTGLQPNQLIVVPGGGHVKYAASEIFDRLLTAAYASPPPLPQTKSK